MASSDPTGVAEAVVQKRRGISIVWIFPIVAAAIAAYLAYVTISEKGPEITISFETADGLEVGKTKVKFRDVEVGTVTDVAIKQDLSGVYVTAELNKGATPYMTDQTRFWVVRPRLGAGEISGLGTLVSGAYIEIDPSDGGTATTSFVGLEEPPLVRSDDRGKTFVLRSATLGSFSHGSPVYFRGFEAGRITGFKLAEDNKSVTVTIFVDEPYDALVRENSRFWNVSGITVSAGADGFEVQTESLEALIRGGIRFETPQTLEPAPQAAEDARFTLYDTREDVEDAAYVQRDRYIVYFEGSVRGLNVGAPVEVRGVKVGEVIDVTVEFNRETMDLRAPVLIELEQGRLKVIGELPTTREEYLQMLIDRGMRAQLQTGSILTGQLLVALDFHPDTPAVIVGADTRYPEIPAIPSELEALAASVTGALETFASLPLNELIEDVRTTFQSLNELVSAPELLEAVRSLDSALGEVEVVMQEAGPDIAPLVRSLRRTADAAGDAFESIDSLIEEDSPLRYDLGKLLEELAAAAQSFRLLADYLEAHPEALISGKRGGQ